MKLSNFVKGPSLGTIGAMAVTVTGGSPEDRLAVKSVIYNALEGARFRGVEYIKEDVPYSFGDVVGLVNEPVEDAESLLTMCAEFNPLLFRTSIVVESAPSLLQSGIEPAEIRGGWVVDPDAVERGDAVSQGYLPGSEAWERAQRTAANDSVKEVVIEGTVRFKF
jgi:hypothetical protein